VSTGPTLDIAGREASPKGIGAPRVPESSSQASPTLDRFLGCEIVVSEVLRVPCNHCAFVVRLSASFAQRPAQTPAQSCALGRGFYGHLISSASAAAPPPGLTAGPIAVDRQPFRHCERGRGATALRVPRHRHQHRSRQWLLSFADSTGRRRSPYPRGMLPRLIRACPQTGRRLESR
jgi:hypothetical protein